MSTNPFDALGLPASPDLDDEQVRAAWRAIAAATHPDRPDGGDVPRYTAAATAYALLRTPWGRSEAYADLDPVAPVDLVDPVDPVAPVDPVGPVGPVGPVDPAGAGTVPRPAGPAAWVLWARVRRGRPVRLALRALAGVILALLAVSIVPGQAAGPAAVTGIVTWFLLTARGDLAPPPGR